MRVFLSPSLLAIAAVLVALPAGAQDASPQAQEPAPQADPETEAPAEDDDNVIYVYAAALAGRVDAAQPPVLELDAEDIAAYGAGSIAELLESLGPQISSGRGRGSGGFPIILVNGVRISSFRELSSYPPEAIERTEIFTEEVAQQYGYSPDQRVVNIVLKRNFSSREVELGYGQPFDGGFSTQEVEGTYLRLAGQSRLNFNAEWNNSSALTEGERGVIQTDLGVPQIPGDPDPADFRTLVPDTSSISATANWTTSLSPGSSLSLNANYSRSDGLSLQGLDSVVLTDPNGATALRTFNPADPLAVDSRSNSYSAGATLATDIGDWQVTATADGTIADSRSRTQARLDTTALVAAAATGQLALDGNLPSFADAGFEEALSDTYRIDSLVTARSTPLRLPAGDVSVTLDTGFTANGIDSIDTRTPGFETQLDRTRFTAGANVNVPLTSRDEEFLEDVGNLSLNVQAGVDHLSDFGTLTDLSLGLTWGVTEKLSLGATWVSRDTAPTLSQLGAPQIVTPNVPIFDIGRNETVLVELVSGGNALLPAQSQSDWKFSANWQLPFMEGASLLVEYFDNHSEDTTESLPLLTPAIEAAFPGRVTRDASGRLTRLDNTFVTFAEQDVRRLQVGLNLSGEIGAGNAQSAAGTGGRQASGAAQGRPAAAPAGAPPAAGGGAGSGQQSVSFDPARFQQMRAQFCEAEPEALLELLNAAVAAAAAGEEPPIGLDGQPLAIPPQMLERLAGEDGRIDPERFAQTRERICSADVSQMGGRPAGQQAGGPPSGRGSGGPPPGGGRGMRFGGPGGGDGTGRWFANLQYAYEIENTVLIADGLPRLDLLNGDALSGAIPRHTLSARGGVFKDGFGVFAFGSYRSEAELEGSDLPGSTDLTFGDFATLSLRAFADLGQQASLVESVPFFEGSRISIGVDNVFDARQRVTDSNGVVPLRYQPFLIDPVGRRFEIEFRKLF
ncbi:hypothetical protein GRI62_08390 [Erythrobacter arachoides]|uniref:TonB-dependent receptor n=1 Tax=Aurantiacibacter arachoides TaxID=1850444 RepID=A0A845A0G4_9SPHN|nr:hypothetical protein [Aurantiacibacter arachoides]MXO93625.1 hypothetical protein [Aurantiacibacter arachoides]GGD47961.1 hypothetical protein GCM10011411_04580 [Aurantiacibacter arachoides]